MIGLGLFHILVVDFSPLCTVFLLGCFLNVIFHVAYVKDELMCSVPVYLLTFENELTHSSAPVGGARSLWVSPSGR